MANQGDGLTLYFLRHGQSEANVHHLFASKKTDPPLSNLGVQQIKSQVEVLKQIEFSALYTSPLLRARQTAEIVGQICGLTPKVIDFLREVDVGVLDGLSIEVYEYRAMFSRIVEQWNLRHNNIGFPGGETLDAVKNRLTAFLKILEGEQNKNILVVAHDILFVAFIWLFCDNHTPKFNDDNIKPGHISIVSKIDGQFHILKHNLAPEILGSK
jgi:broad specificity phosphatase PhoE